MNHDATQPRAGLLTPVRVLAVLACSATLGLPACSSQPEKADRSGDFRGLDAGDAAARRNQPVPSRVDTRVATAAGAPVSWEDLEPAMAEAAGGLALQELALDRMLAAELRTRNLTITGEEVARERNLVVEAIAQGAQASPEDTERLLNSVRQRRGLGPTRFDRLMERTARMRKLVADQVTISDEELRQAYEMRHGARYRARVIMVDSDRRAAELRAQLEAAAAEQRAVHFADAATKHSIDPSAARGGVLEPISPLDPAYPASVRGTLQRMKPGEISPVVAVDRGFAILLLEEVIPGDGRPIEEVRGAIEREVRLRRERLAMDDLARRLLRAADVTVFDRSLGWGWQNVQSEPPQ